MNTWSRPFGLNPFGLNPFGLNPFGLNPFGLNPLNELFSAVGGNSTTRAWKRKMADRARRRGH